jgi:hypothetical protein
MPVEALRCEVCSSDKLERFTAEIAVHFPGLTNLHKPHVYVSADLVVCLNCGTAQLAVPEMQLRELAKGAAAG